MRANDTETIWEGKPRGYTDTPEVRAILRPLVEGVEARMSERFDWFVGGGDCRRFEGMNMEAAKRLLELGALVPDMTQNDSPSVQEFIDILDGMEGATLHGYWITPERDDERISIEGAAGVVSTEDFMQRVMPRMRLADEFDYTPISPERVQFRAWWD